MRKIKFTAVLLTVLAVTVSIIPVSSASAVSCPFGDMSVDGQITAADARLALRFAVDLEYYTKAHLKIGDTDSDGVISASDARMILRASVGLEKFDPATVEVDESDFGEFINRPEDYLFKWNVPEEPEITADPGTFTFTYYGRGHGVGLSCYGALSLEDGGYTYDRILSHYYTGTTLLMCEEIPEVTYYGGTEVNTEELVATIVLQEIYGIPGCENYEEALKAMTVCVFTNLKRYEFNVYDIWSVGSTGNNTYENVPENLRNVVKEVFGKYISPEGEDRPIEAVYYSMAAGMTASSEIIWGGKLSYLSAVPSPFDMQRPNFISQRTYTVDEMKDKILSYDSSIVLGEDPAEWIEILEHSASIDENRGYVIKIRVGDKELSGFSQFHSGLMKMTGSFMSSCFTVTYIPYE